MFNRYGDKTKFITDKDSLEVENNEVIISAESDYDIVIDLEGCYDTFENLKNFIVIVAKHICEMDNTVLRFNNKKRIKDMPLGQAKLPSSFGCLRFDYSIAMENEPEPVEKDFPFILSAVYIDKPDFVTLDYWATDENNQFTVSFEYKDNKFYLRQYGMFDCIPDDWDKS